MLNNSPEKRTNVLIRVTRVDETSSQWIAKSAILMIVPAEPATLLTEALPTRVFLSNGAVLRVKEDADDLAVAINGEEGVLG